MIIIIVTFNFCHTFFIPTLNALSNTSSKSSIKGILLVVLSLMTINFMASIKFEENNTRSFING